jgi:hypothetical protein
MQPSSGKSVNYISNLRLFLWRRSLEYCIVVACVEFAMRPNGEPLTRRVHSRDGQTKVTVYSGRRRVSSCVWGTLRARGGAAECIGPLSALLHTALRLDPDRWMMRILAQSHSKAPRALP